MNEMKSYSQAVTGVSFFKNPFDHLGIVLFCFKLGLCYHCFKQPEVSQETRICPCLSEVRITQSLCGIASVITSPNAAAFGFRGHMGLSQQSAVPGSQACLSLRPTGLLWRTSCTLDTGSCTWPWKAFPLSLEGCLHFLTSGPFSNNI